MKKIMIILVTIGFSLLLFGCGLDTENFKTKSDENLEATLIYDYIDNVKKDTTYSYKEKKKEGNYTVNIKAEVNDKFKNLDNLDKFLILTKSAETMDSTFLPPTCGDSDCEYGKLILVTSDNKEYTTKIKHSFIEDYDIMYGPDGNPVALEDFYKSTKQEAEPKKEVKKEDTDDTEAFNNTSPSQSSSSVDEDVVYLYMKELYDTMTHYGDNYDPETHDPIIAGKASERFNITEKKATDIYIKKDKEYLLQ